MVFSDEYKILIKSLYLKGYTAKRLTDEFPETSLTKRDVNKLFKKLRDTEPPNATIQEPALFRATHISLKKITMPSYA